VFYPGAAAGAFIRQYDQAGLKDELPLYSVFTVDAISLPRLQDADFQAVLGSRMTQQWDPSLDNAANRKFVADFKAEYGTYPSFYAAQSYDAIMLIASAVAAVDGNLDDKDGLRAALQGRRFRLGARRFPLRQQQLPDPGLLPARGRGR
jgi:branched-chain amino acid transport system substrate-binding protein